MEKVRPVPGISSDQPTVTLAVILLGCVVISSLTIVLPANLLALYNRTGLDQHVLVDAGVLAFVRVILAFITLGFLYIAAFRTARQAKGKLAWAIVIGGTLILGVIFLFMVPFDALDIYDNIFHGRILGIYEANPFQRVIADFPKDPFFKFTWWTTSPSAYGPGWEMLAGFTARLVGNGLFANILAFKLLPGLFHLVSLAMVLVFLHRAAPENALTGALLLGWNPVVLYETWGNGHNDMAMVFWILLVVVWLDRSRYTLAGLSLAAGTLFKFIPALLFPAVLLAGYRNLKSFGARLRFILWTTFASGVLIVAAYLPFWNGVATLSIDRRMEMFTTSIPAVMYRLLVPLLGTATSSRWISLGALAFLAGFVLFQTFRMERQDPARGFLQVAFNILAFYLMVTCLWFQQWYGLWLIGLAPLLSERSQRIALVFGFWVISKQLIFGAIIVPQMVSNPQAMILLEPLLTVTVLGLPWALVWLEFHKSRKMKASLHVT
jgi:hypothetical protein